MKSRENVFQRYGAGLILFGVSPALGLLLIYGSVAILFRLFRERMFELPVAALSLALLLVGLGLLQFSYLVLFKKEAHLSSGVIYLASVAFMFLGVFAAVYPFAVSLDVHTVYAAGRGAGVFVVGLGGFLYARSRKKQNQSPHPTRASGPHG